MQAEPTRANRALASAVNSRIAADARSISAKAALLRMVGIGSLVALSGLGAGLAFFGYSYVNDSRTSTAKMADAFAQALERSTLKTTGEVSVASGGTVSLDTNGAQVGLTQNSAVRLDASEAFVKLDPQAEVRVRDSNHDLPRPSQAQLGSSAAPASKASVVTEFTVFKHVRHGKGQVVTGWKFSDSEQKTPRSEYCYYSEGVEAGVELTIHLANDGRINPNSKSTPSVDTLVAASNCVWFSGGTINSTGAEAITGSRLGSTF